MISDVRNKKLCKSEALFSFTILLENKKIAKNVEVLLFVYQSQSFD